MFRRFISSGEIMYTEILSKLPSAVLYVQSGQDFITYANVAAMQFFAPLPLQDLRIQDLLYNEDQRTKFRDFLNANQFSDESSELLFKSSTPATPSVIDSASFQAKPDAGVVPVVGFLRRTRVSDGNAFILRSYADVTNTGMVPGQVAIFDGLTGLPNRELLRDRMRQAIHIANRSVSRDEKVYLGVLFIDLDRFKSINDTYGHASGDAVLYEISVRLRACVRESDTVARLGGDEFVVLVCNLHSQQETVVVAERILDACSKPILVGDNAFQISASVGVAAWPTDGLSVDELLNNADQAMYSSKNAGRNGLRFWDVQMNEKAEARAQIEADLKEALADGDFVLYYQPQFCVRSNRIVAVEALIRWLHPTRGLIAPDSFIQVAEESNLISPIGDWVLKEAVRQGRQWLDAGIELRVAVNLSGRQFVDELPGRVRDVLAEYDFPASLLELELTESFLVSDTEKAARILHALRDLGVRVALDDFGTGWSSLNYLKSFPVDTLKIDRSFIGATPTEFDGRIVRAILAIAREFNLSTLAEGVETREQMQSLQALGCDGWQGFLLSSAISAESLAEFCRNTDMAANRFLALPDAT